MSLLFRFTPFDGMMVWLEVAIEPGPEPRALVLPGMTPSMAFTSLAFVSHDVRLPSTGGCAGATTADARSASVDGSLAARTDLRNGDGAGSVGKCSMLVLCGGV